MGYAGKVNIGGNDYPIAMTLYGTCPTAADQSPKVVTLANFDQLIEGVVVAVKFTYSNTHATPSLKFGNTDAAPIVTSGTGYPGTVPELSWPVSSVQFFLYDGSYWHMINEKFALKSLANQLAAEYDTTASYVAGNVCIYKNKLYVATAPTSGAWDVNDWTACTILSRILELETTIDATIAPNYDNTATYHINDLRIYDRKLYRAKVDISTAEEWNSEHWERTTVASEREYKLEFFNKEINIQSTVSAEVTATGITEATVNKQTWEEVISQDGTYIFRFVNTEWVYNSNIVTLSTYGISYPEGETPDNGDIITVTYVPGQYEFKLNGTYAAYPYRAQVDLEGVDENMIPEVVFGLDDAISSMFAPIAETYSGGIYLYATNIPQTSITLPTIICKR